jgi:hypothetical protein
MYRGVVLQRHDLCFKDFPDQCEGCPEYRVNYPSSVLPLSMLTGTGIIYPERLKNVIVKECKLYHKRKVENLE